MKRTITTALAPIILLSGCSFIPGTEAHDEKIARDVFKTSLYDGESARLLDVRYKNVERDGKQQRILCGQVNAKNRMGAYVGFHRFVVVPDEQLGIVDPQATKDSSDEEKVAQSLFYDTYAYCDPEARSKDEAVPKL
jgi:hypothetical protein